MKNRCWLKRVQANRLAVSERVERQGEIEVEVNTHTLIQTHLFAMNLGVSFVR